MPRKNIMLAATATATAAGTAIAGITALASQDEDSQQHAFNAFIGLASTSFALFCALCCSKVTQRPKIAPEQPAEPLKLQIITTSQDHGIQNRIVQQDFATQHSSSQYSPTTIHALGAGHRPTPLLRMGTSNPEETSRKRIEQITAKFQGLAGELQSKGANPEQAAAVNQCYFLLRFNKVAGLQTEQQKIFNSIITEFSDSYQEEDRDNSKALTIFTTKFTEFQKVTKSALEETAERMPHSASFVAPTAFAQSLQSAVARSPGRDTI